MLLGEDGHFSFEDDVERNRVRAILNNPDFELVEEAFDMNSAAATTCIAEFSAEDFHNVFEAGRRLGDLQSEIKVFQRIIRLLKEDIIRTSEDEGDTGDILEMEAFEEPPQAKKELE